MSKPSRTAAASAGAKNLIYLNINRRELGRITLLLVLRWLAENGQMTEPESYILTGRAGMLKRYANQGYLVQYSLPPGLKGAPHFSHEHYYHLAEKGLMLIAMQLPDLSEYGNVELRQRVYLHDFIGRIEAAWRVRTCEIDRYVPEIRLPDLCTKNQKQHDGHYICVNGERIGVEIEAFDRKSGDKLARFAAQCMNSITNDRVQKILILVQTEAARIHYAKSFEVDREYCQEWVLGSGRWHPKISSKVKVSEDLAAKISVKLLLTELKVREIVSGVPTEMFWEAEQDNENWFVNL